MHRLGNRSQQVAGPDPRAAPIPVITLPQVPFAPADKVPAVAAFVAGRPAVWIDDLHTAEGRRWAAGRGPATLLIDVDPNHGLQRSMIDRALTWAASPTR